MISLRRHSKLKTRFALSILAGFLTLTLAQPAAAGPDRKQFGKNQTCQDFTRTVFYQGGRSKISNGTACLRRDGNWYVVRESIGYQGHDRHHARNTHRAQVTFTPPGRYQDNRYNHGYNYNAHRKPQTGWVYYDRPNTQHRRDSHDQWGYRR